MLEQKIQKTLNEALKSGEKVKLSTLRLLMSDIKNKKIEDRVKELEDDKVITLIQKMVRRYKESIEQFSDGGREDLVKKESEEMAILEEYLPKELSEEELVLIIDEAIKASGATSPQDMGKVMKCALETIKGRADGSVVSRIVKEKLS